MRDEFLKWCMDQGWPMPVLASAAVFMFIFLTFGLADLLRWIGIPTIYGLPILSVLIVGVVVKIFKITRSKGTNE
jgi:hypothetical protein